MSTQTKAKISPLHDRVLLKKIEAAEKTSGGIILPETAKEKNQTMVIVAVGPGAKDTKTGTILPMAVKQGQTVIVEKYAGTEISFEGEDYFIVKEGDIVAVIGS